MIYHVLLIFPGMPTLSLYQRQRVLKTQASLTSALRWGWAMTSTCPVPFPLLIRILPLIYTTQLAPL